MTIDTGQCAASIVMRQSVGYNERVETVNPFRNHPLYWNFEGLDMAQTTWEKPLNAPAAAPNAVRLNRWKFLIGAALMLAAVAYLIIAGTTGAAQPYLTVEQLLTNPQYVGKTVQITGAVLGDSIRYDSRNLIIDFTIAHLPSDYENLAVALNQAVNTPDSPRMPIRVVGQVKPDLLQHEAQAILSGKLDASGVFHATELLLKCPTRFQEAQPGQSIVNPSA